MGLLLLFAVIVIVFLGSYLIPFVLLLIIPGRKGSMRTVREIIVPLGADEAWQRTADRFAYEGFAIEVDEGDRPTRFSAKRPARHYHEEGERIVTHATKPLSAEVTITPAGGAQRVTVALWMNDFVFFDSGEGRQIDLMLHRLLTQELDREPPPVTRSMTYNAIAAFTGACLTIALASLPLVWPWLGGTNRRLFGFAIGIIASGAMSIGTAKAGLAAIRAKPDEVTGKPLAIVASALGGVAAATGVAWIVVAAVGRLFPDE